MYTSNHSEFSRSAQCAELTFNEIETVNGGIVPLAALGAVAATTALIGLVDGIFTGIAEDEQRKAEQDAG